MRPVFGTSFICAFEFSGMVVVWRALLTALLALGLGLGLGFDWLLITTKKKKRNVPYHVVGLHVPTLACSRSPSCCSAAPYPRRTPDATMPHLTPYLLTLHTITGPNPTTVLMHPTHLSPGQVRTWPTLPGRTTPAYPHSSTT